MIRIGAILLLFVIQMNAVLAQSGSYLVSKHSPEISQQNIYYDGIINDIGTIFLASRNGLIKYDGNRSSMINTGGSVFDLAFNQKEEVFLATSVGLLLMRQTIDHENEIINLMPANNQTPVNQVLASEKAIYGVANDIIYYRTYDSDTTFIIRDEHAGGFYNIYQLGDHIYINSGNKGTLEVVDGRISSDVPDFIEKQTIVFSSLNTDTNQHIFGTSSGQIFTYEEDEITPLSIEDQMLKEGEPIMALWYDKETIVIGTLTEGVFFINVKTGKTKSRLDYNTGLEDNEVVSLIMDKNKGLSVVSNYALNHVSPNISIKSFQYYDGLYGDITSTAYYKDKLYVGTNVGLFSLQKITDYEEIVSYKKRRKKVSKSKPAVVLEQTKTRKKLFNFKNRKAKKKAKKQQVAQEEQEAVEQKEAVVITEKKVTKKATAVYYAYKEVDTRISHVSQILSLEDHLIIGGLTGVFEIVEEQVNMISENDARYLYISEDNSQLFISTGDQQVLVFVKQGNSWIYRDVFTDFRAQVDHIREYKGDYWLSSPDKIYKVEISNNQLDDIIEYELENPYYSTLYSTVVSNELNFISSNGSYKIQGDSIKSVNSPSQINDIIIDNNNDLWTFLNNDWKQPNRFKSDFPVFKIFKNLKSITYDANNTNFWVVTQTNEILRFSEKLAIPASYYTPYLEKVKATNTSRAKDKIVVVQDESQLSFEIAYADLSNIFDTKYRYQLKGMDDVWSKWSKESTINFSFLPAGSYTLSIQAQNAFGKAYEISPTSFKVLQPYWKRPLFYAFEIAVVLSLFLLSITLKSWGYKYRLISRLLAFLTLVIIMEYMEAVMESYFLLESSPVFSFALQVLMAMIILPFEGVLKKYVFKEKIDLGTYFELKGKEKFGKS